MGGTLSLEGGGGPPGSPGGTRLVADIVTELQVAMLGGSNRCREAF